MVCRFLFGLDEMENDMKKFCVMIIFAALVIGAAGCTAMGGESVTPTPQVTVTPSPTPIPTPTPIPVPADDSIAVRVRDYIPNIAVDLRYAGENNFTGQVIYDFSEPYLRYGTVKKLAAVQAELNALGYSLLIWDAYRPPAAQFKLWEIVPDGNYVANPYNGYSSHSCGNTVDVSLVMLDGSAVELPSDFDEFSATGDRDYSDVSDTAAANARLLEQIMSRCGFNGYWAEWWHFSDTVSYEAEDLHIESK